MPGRLPQVETYFGSPLRLLVEATVDRLIAGGVREDLDLDVKQALYGNSDRDKRDLAGDVAAMANTIGGAIVFGIGEDDAVAVEPLPVALSVAPASRRTP